jgi:hypothetical protein
MHKENEIFGVAFDLPDEPDYVTILAYDEQAELNRDVGLYNRLWIAAQKVITNWQCEKIQLADNLSTKASKDGLNIVKWVGLAVWNWRQELDDLPKN